MKNEVKELLEILPEVFKGLHQRSYHKLNDKLIYPGQPKLLSLIKANEGITQKELAEKNCVTPATITGMLNKLEVNGFVYRVPDKVDKRTQHVYLTPEGIELAESSRAIMISLVENLFDDFSDEELKTLLVLSKKMKNNLRNNDK